MIESLDIFSLVLILIGSSIIVWITGVMITKVTDVIDRRFHIGHAFGGLILLAIVTNLPEIAIVTSAALTHNMGIAVGNILGSIAIQTVVLVLLDGVGLRYQGVLTYKPISLKIVLEGLLVVFVLLITIMCAQLPKSVILFRLSPGDLAIIIAWVGGLWLIRKGEKYLPWRKMVKIHETKKEIQSLKKIHSFYIVIFFLCLSTIILIAGVLLEQSSSAIALKIGWSSSLFGATFLAAITALPEVSTGLAAMKMRNYTLAISDIFGGNAFLLVLFPLATVLSGSASLSELHSSDIYLASLSAILTVIYLFGLIFSSKRQYFWLGIDSIIVLLIYLIGIAGLFLLS